jgi:hypothetical protein
MVFWSRVTPDALHPQTFEMHDGTGGLHCIQQGIHILHSKLHSQNPANQRIHHNHHNHQKQTTQYTYTPGVDTPIS